MGGKLAVVAAAAAFVVPSAHAASTVNPQIAGLQVALRAHGLYLGAIDGISGPMTAGALHRFQRKHGLPVGIADARTREALGPLGRPLFGARVLRRGAFGWDVSVLQFLLTRAGYYNGALDGYLDKITSNALRRYQQHLRVTADGVLGPRTLAAVVRRDAVPVRPQVVHATFVVYRVRAGDTLTLIAARYRTTVAALANANGINPARPILIGQRLRLPQVTAPPTLEPSSATVRGLLDNWSTRLGVDPHLVRALAWMESGYQTRLVSSAGARGVLQLLPVTREYVATVLAGHAIPNTVSGDIEAGVLLIRHLLQAFNGDARLAVGAWYAGEREVRQNGVGPITSRFVANVLALRTRM
jgi:LysM repeat protein